MDDHDEQKNKGEQPVQALSCIFAEGEGFKPPIPERGIPDFESSAIDHSANLPLRFAKVQHFFILSKNLF